MKNIKIVIGANFGDEGKGLMTDYFSTHPSTLVVCHNGGAQRGHTVVTPTGKRHVFNHFGSGTLVGADTYLSEDYVINPMLFAREYRELFDIEYLSKSIPKVFVSEKCMVTTPYDMMINQIVEESRSSDKHGSCGTGIFETITRNKLESCQLSAKTALNDNLWMTSYIESFLRRIKDIYMPKRLEELKVSNTHSYLTRILKDTNANEAIIENYIRDIEFMKEHTVVLGDNEVKALFNSRDNIVFESGQGLLLDQNNVAYFPHLTPSNTGSVNPVKIIKANGLNSENVEVCYVTRSYMTRHGAGSFETECSKDCIGENLIDQTNVPNPFQDTLRYGKLDMPLMISSIKKDLQNFDFNKSVSLAITHLDETRGALKCSDYDRFTNDISLNMFSAMYTSFGASRGKIMKTMKGMV